jgi:hypothetical protein
MFSKAYAIATKYTRPVMVSKRLENRSVAAGIATYILLNNDGWALTAAHVMLDLMASQKHAQERAEYAAKVHQIENNPVFSAGKKRHEINQLKRNAEWITNVSYWWGDPGVAPSVMHIDQERDLAAVKLIGFEKLKIGEFPTFAAPPANEVSPGPGPGTSLCRLGFPFHVVMARFDDAIQQFKVDNMPPLTMFPNEGIHTRTMLQLNAATGRQTRFLETSSAGLRGQSGGPIFDVDGRIWAIQSRTLSIPLGFAPTVKQGKHEITEHQFIHIGVGCYVAEVRDFLTAFNIPFASAA